VTFTHPFFPEINSIGKKYYGIDKIIEQILNDETFEFRRKWSKLSFR